MTSKKVDAVTKCQTEAHLEEEEKLEPVVTLLSSDDVVFTIPRDAAMLSDLIADIIIIDDDSDERELEGYKLERVVSSTLQKVVEYLTYYHVNPMIPIPDVVLSS
jgi:hypothetical protein